MAAVLSSSELSSPRSFCTANDSTPEKSTAASSPVQENPYLYRHVRPLPPELKDHCQILIEEQLYTGAINLLNSIVCSGASNRTRKNKSIPIPPPSHLALLNTLIVHPLHTTRVEKQDHLGVCSQALDYLRNLLVMVGPLNADLRTAFQFHSTPRNSRRVDNDLSDGDSDPDQDRLRGKIANEGSIWSSGRDFWATLGWAFNCSALHPQRWRFWKLWLHFMIDVLDRDWEERTHRDKEAGRLKGGHGAMPQTWRQESIILMYMNQQDGRQGIRNIIKALFADGSDISSSAFRSVFGQELRGPRKQSNKRKRDRVLDLENDKFGDYFDDEFSSGVSEPPTPQKPKDARKNAGTFNNGLVESIRIRQHLFKMISAATAELRKDDLDQLYQEYATALKVLPLPIFSLLVNQRPNHLLPASHVTVTRDLFHRLLPSSHKKPAKVDPESYADGSLSPLMLEHCYLPNAANTVAIEDNAKLSLLIESSIQLFRRMCPGFQFTKGMIKAAETGIEAREAKTKRKRTGKMKTDAADAFAEEVLANSAERIRVLIEVFGCPTDAEEDVEL